MSADSYHQAIDLGRTGEPGRNLRRGWGAVTILIVAAVFVEAVFAGAMLSGAGWAHAAHRAGALALVASTLIAGLAGLITLRRTPHGVGLGLTLLALGATLFVQMALGAASTHGANLLWLHVPLGVALLGFAGLAALAARRLGEA